MPKQIEQVHMLLFDHFDLNSWRFRSKEALLKTVFFSFFGTLSEIIIRFMSIIILLNVIMPTREVTSKRSEKVLKPGSF